MISTSRNVTIYSPMIIQESKSHIIPGL